ncbi:hypothetical protein OBBRIDRAFT_801361 [Obba rivulosa]|uniref:Uncharacterized protein n=1 Tax=Obba rivulosa TaxID=1052685 RepID=A0A8E2J401_9APHY|nr:hypothetical protein OBBRIDRAFT_801361 [Obba rivulosa]
MDNQNRSTVGRTGGRRHRSRTSFVRQGVAARTRQGIDERTAARRISERSELCANSDELAYDSGQACGCTAQEQPKREDLRCRKIGRGWTFSGTLAEAWEICFGMAGAGAAVWMLYWVCGRVHMTWSCLVWEGVRGKAMGNPWGFPCAVMPGWDGGGDGGRMEKRPEKRRREGPWGCHGVGESLSQLLTATAPVAGRGVWWRGSACADRGG